MSDPRIIDCPRCNEGDERPLGTNICSLCECRFVVRADGTLFVPSMSKRISSAITCQRPEGEPHG